MNILLLLTAVALVSTAGLFAHRALAETTPLALAAWRLGIAALFFAGWQAVRPAGNGLKDTHLLASQVPPVTGGLGTASITLRLLLAGACLATHFLVWFAALQTASVARATLLVCTTPLWTTLGAVLLRRRRFTVRTAVALLLASVGVSLVTGAAAHVSSPAALRGDGLALTGGALFAAYLLLMEGMHRHVPARRQVTWTYSAAAILLWAALLVTQSLPRLTYTAGVWRAIVGMAVGPQILGHTLLNNALRHFSPSVVAFAILLEPPLAAGLAQVIFGQTITLTQAAGGLLTLCALALVLGERAAPHPSPAVV